MRQPTGLVLYWFPASVDEMKNSELASVAHPVCICISQCVSMEWADGRTANADKLMGDSKLPVAVAGKT